jgi:hypothetical protein
LCVKEHYEAHKDVVAAQGIRYRAAHREALTVHRNEYKRSHKAAISEKGKLYAAANKEEIAARNKVRYESHKDAVAEKGKVYRELHKDEVAEKKKLYYESHKEQISAYKKAYQQANPGKIKAAGAKRRANKLNATPAWFEKDAIAELYVEAISHSKLEGIIYHVDHIVPLQSKLVCGLHCLDNLQVITEKENCSKSNRHWPGQEWIIH